MLYSLEPIILLVMSTSYYKKTPQAKAYIDTVNQLIDVAEDQFGTSFRNISSKQLHTWLLNNNYEPSVVKMIESYRVSLEEGDHNDGRWADYLINDQDTHRFDRLYQVATRMYLGRKQV